MQPGDVDERDGLISGPARRRGAGLNPGNRFEKVRLHVLGEERERQRVERIEAGGDENTPCAAERRGRRNGFVSSAARASPMAHFPVFRRPLRFCAGFDWVRLGSFRRFRLNWMPR
jgi:hypothetical protein